MTSPNRRFPYGRPIDWRPELNAAWAPAVAFIAWRTVTEGRAWTLPLYLIGGYMLGIGLRHASRHSPSGRVRELEHRLENLTVVRLLLYSVVLTVILFVVVGAGIVFWEAISDG